jgi:adenine phosphoribosyltransferase
LPGKTVSRDYDLEYGKASLEVHTDLIPNGSKVLLVDDVLATGGTAIAATNLLKDIGLTVSSLVFLLDIPELNGKARIKTTLNDPQMTIILAN